MTAPQPITTQWALGPGPGGQLADRTLAAEWQALADRQERPSPFCSYDWHAQWWQQAHGFLGLDPALLLLRGGDGTLVGLMPMAIRRKGPFRRLEWLSREVTDFPDLLLAPSIDLVKLAPILQAGLRKAPAHYLDLDFIMPDARIAQLLPVKTTTDLDRKRVYWIDLAQGLAGYEDGLSANLKRNLKSQPRKAERTLGPLALKVADRDAERARIMAFVCQSKPDNLKDEADVPLYRAAKAPFLETAFTKADASYAPFAHLTGLYAGETLIAAHAGFIADGEFWLYQTATHPDHRALSPGLLLRDRLVRLAAEKGLKRFSFMRGDEPYKTEWTAQFTRSLTCVCPVNLIGSAALALRWARQKILRIGTD